jgi:hypothetical protein
VHIVVACAVTNVLETFVVVSGPEEWSVAIWDKLAKHVEGCVRALIQSVDPMFNPGLLTGLPVGERTNVTCSVDVWGRRLQEWVTYDRTLSIQLDSCFFSLKELGGWSNSCSNDHHIDLNLLAIIQKDCCDISVFILDNLFDAIAHIQLDSSFRVLSGNHLGYFFA